MDKLKELTNDIHLKIPRLMDDGVGQIYEWGDSCCTMISFDPIEESCILFDGERSHQWYLSEIQTKFQPLGMEPMLNDVLEYLYKLPPMERYNMQTLINFWDLTKPYLKDQSNETIDFLCNLLKLCQN